VRCDLRVSGPTSSLIAIEAITDRQTIVNLDQPQVSFIRRARSETIFSVTACQSGRYITSPSTMARSVQGAARGRSRATAVRFSDAPNHGARIRQKTSSGARGRGYDHNFWDSRPAADVQLAGALGVGRVTPRPRNSDQSARSCSSIRATS